MESAPRPDPHQEWRLGIDPEQAHRAEPALPGPPSDLSRESLERPLHVLTVEHLAWLLLAAWALISRLAAVGARPLAANEARHALFAYDLANRTKEAAAAGFQPTWSGWIHLVQAGIFAAFGSSDIAARALSIVSGLVLLAMAFGLRRSLGRAGAIALAAMLTTSTTVSWFSRDGTAVICTASLALVTLALFMALQARPARGRAVALGIGAGLMVSADPTGMVTAVVFLKALAWLGLFELVTTRNAYLRARVWLELYRSHVAITGLTALAVVLASQLVVGLGGAGLGATLGYLMSPRPANWRAGLDAIILPLGFYEFLIVIAGVAGVAVVAAARVPTRLAFFCLIWTALSWTFYLLAAPRAPGDLVMILLPTAVLGGIAADYLHHSWAWRNLRYATVALLLFAVHAQALTNFTDYAPDTTEPVWARRANLFWRDGATIPAAVEHCRTLLKDIPSGNATVFHRGGDWPAALRWYLRELRPVTSADAAAVVVATDAAAHPGDNPAHARRIDFEERWIAAPGALNPARALLYFFTQRAWGDVTFQSATIEAGPQSIAPAPTLILPLNNGP